MKTLTINRNKSDDVCLEGEFLVDGAQKWYTLERPWMNGSNTPKVASILPGTYEVIVDYSPHFGRFMPHIINVPGRTNIRIHPANWVTQLEGCIAIGKTEGKDYIGMSDAAFDEFIALLDIELKSGKVFLTINNLFGG
jgi:hypothetical protein